MRYGGEIFRKMERHQKFHLQPSSDDGRLVVAVLVSYSDMKEKLSLPVSCKKFSSEAF